MDKTFRRMYFKDPGGPLPPGFWIGVIMLAILFCYMHGCSGGVSS